MQHVQTGKPDRLAMTTGKQVNVAKRRNRVRVSKRDRDIYERYMIRGEKQADIAEAYGISVPRVSQICSRTEAALAEAFESTAVSLRIRSTLRLEHLYQSVIDEYHRSNTREVVDKQGEIKTLQCSKDPRLAAEARAIIAEANSLWGAYAPKKTEHVGDPLVAIQANINTADPSVLAELAEASRALDRLSRQQVIEVEATEQPEAE